MCIKTFGELSRYEKISLFTAWLDGNVIQVKSKDSEDADVWSETTNPQWWDDLFYRVKPKPVVKPKIPWEHVKPKWKWFAFDRDGENYFYVKEPELHTEVGIWKSCDDISISDSLVIEKTCDWQDSLVERPSECN